MRRIVYISFLLLLSCSAGSTESAKVVSIASLRDVESNSNTQLITKNFWVEGVVTANDKYGEFSNCIFLEDQSAALKLMCDVEDNYRLYPIGKRVRLSCSGLYLRNLYGAIVIGSAPTEEYTVGTISQRDIGRYLTSIEDDKLEFEVDELPIEALTPLRNYSLIQLSRVKIVSETGVTTFCTRDSLTGRTQHTSHVLIDADSNLVELRVNRNCTYADSTLPTDEVSLGVIVDYYDGKYSATISGYTIE